MCGIIAYKGNKKASDILLKGIKSLEYRGYDSVGMVILDNNDLSLKKDIGKIKEVDEKVNFLELKGNIGMAHTRWATTGGVTKLTENGRLLADAFSKYRTRVYKYSDKIFIDIFKPILNKKRKQIWNVYIY